jgi:hypothetical protein
MTLRRFACGPARTMRSGPYRSVPAVHISVPIHAHFRTFTNFRTNAHFRTIRGWA